MMAAAAGDEFPPDIIHGLRVICRAIIREQAKLFGDLPAIDKDDLEQEGMIVACKRHKQFDTKRGASYSVVIGEAVRNRIIDLYRVATKGKARERLVASVRSELDEVPNATPAIATPAPETDFTITDLKSQVAICRVIDDELAHQLEQIAAATDHEIVTALQASTFTLQRIRMRLVGAYLPIVIGTRKFTTSNFVMCAPKPKQED